MSRRMAPAGMMRVERPYPTGVQASVLFVGCKYHKTGHIENGDLFYYYDPKDKQETFRSLSDAIEVVIDGRRWERYAWVRENEEAPPLQVQIKKEPLEQ